MNADFKTENGDIETCNVEIWERPWLNTDEAVSFTLDCPTYGPKTFQHEYVKH